ncbi:hypothetical protein LB505_013005 [Fusarium chuoi]|nr:hypothetical protein LB505_013005 [Fusarium chuoi]
MDKFPLSDIQLVSDAERHLILSRSVSTRKVQATTIPALFEKTVARFPERVAVDFQGDTSLTFAKLNSLSNQLARRLRLGKGLLIWSWLFWRFSRLDQHTLSLIQNSQSVASSKSSTIAKQQRFYLLVDT